MDTTLEQNAFSMFKAPSTDEYKRHILVSVKNLINENPRITVNKLKGQMKTKYFAQEEDVDGALSALLNVFCCISVYKVPNRDATHLNSKPSSMWVDGMPNTQLQMA